MASKNVDKVLAYCEEVYPEHKPVVVEDTDIIIIYLRHPESNFADKDLVLYYNTWYKDEYNVSKLISID